jgi:predicted unusual protein kinase regulating ubiquinone biosynthesis (AarF/ABC1/UbiB family)
VSEQKRRVAAPVPQGRLGRLMRLGLAAGELAVGGAVEGLRRIGTSGPINARSVLLTAKNAERLASRLARMRGAAMKLGQLLSLEGEDLFPPEFARALSVLRSSAAPMPPAQLHRVLGREYGASWRGRFERFDEEPIAAASIGQVHRARAHGRELALKIQYPGVARSISADVDNVAALLRLIDLFPVQVDVEGITAEAKRQLSQEADYALEARFLERYRRLVADEPRLTVPRVQRDLSTRHVLAMDYVEGAPLEGLVASGLSQEQRDAAAEVLERLLFRELFEFRFMQTDPNFANYMWDPERERIVLLDFGSVREFTPAFVEKYKRTVRAVLANDHEGVRRGAVEIGYLAADAPPAAVHAAVDVIMLVCEPLRHRGRYDFGASTLSARARDVGFDLGVRQGLLQSPPPETIFLHRKLAGSFFMLARLGARIDARALVAPFVA